MAYYSIFSLSPLLVIAVAVAGFFADEAMVESELHGKLVEYLGNEGAKGVERMLIAAQKPTQSAVATVLGLIALMWGASGVFTQLQAALNKIWEVEPPPRRGIMAIVRSRLLPFAMVFGTAFLLLASLVASTFVQAAGRSVGNLLPGTELALRALNIGISFPVITLLFACIFKYIPDASIAWKDVWIGAAATAGLFLIGNWALGLYLGRGTFSSAYGAAGSLIVVLLWFYYSSQILFLGAEFTQAFAHSHGSRVAAKPQLDRAFQGASSS
jgi:membrane protein